MEDINVQSTSTVNVQTPPREIARPRILIVDDDPSACHLLEKILKTTYATDRAATAEEALGKLSDNTYAAILLDVLLPGASGLDLCQRLKADIKLRHIPIILVTGQGGMDNLVQGLRLGADDFLPKPFNAEELLARTEAVIRRSVQNLEANPLTHLPGNGTIEREIRFRLQSKNIFSVLYIDLNHFKAYNDYYGFYRGDLVLGRVADILLHCGSGPDQLVGHLGGDDFVIVIGDGTAETISARIIEEFHGAVPSFYDPKDFRAGFILTRDRNNKEQFFPLLSLSIGVVTNKVRPLQTLGEVATIGAELKNFAKRHNGSFCAVDRRTDPYPSGQAGH